MRSQDNVDKQEGVSIEIHHADDTSDYTYDVRCYVDGELWDSDSYYSLADAKRRQREIATEFKATAREVERDYRAGLVDSLKSASDGAQSGSPEHKILRCLAKQMRKSETVGLVMAALRDAGLC